jgi:hypothetical protein
MIPRALVTAFLVTLSLAPAALADSNVAPCDKAALGTGPPNWAQESLTAGPVGVFRHPLSRMFRTGNGQLTAKMPILVEGQKSVTVSVPPGLRGRVFLYYGRILDREGHPTTSFADANGYGETRFEPCAGRSRTPWPGGVRIKGTAPVHLTVWVEGRDEPFQLRLGRPKIYSP